MAQVHSHMSVFQHSVSALRFAPRTSAMALKRVWTYLTLHDNWQGELCVVVFGALGWSLIAMLSDDDYTAMPQYRVMTMIMGKRAWEAYFIIAAAVQLYGMKGNSCVRVIGAALIFKGFLEITLSGLVEGMVLPGLACYMACIAIEFCAIIYHAAKIVRFKEYPAWVYGLTLEGRTWIGRLFKS